MTSRSSTSYSSRTESAAARLYLATVTPFALSFAAGAINVFAFQNLRRFFTADPTGSSTVVPEIVGAVAGVSVAALAFAASLFAGLHGTAVRDERRPSRIPTAPWAFPAVAGALVVTWTSVMGLDVGNWLLVIALSAAALALQAAGARRITDSAGGPVARTSLGGHRQSRAWMRTGSIPALVA
ncbi:hypothetical protein, partial [Paractinoplanes brasiliensis]